MKTSHTILITAYAINPYKGSEDGTGWNWVYQLSRHHRVIAITRKNNIAEIHRYLEENEVPHRGNMEFIGYDLPYWMRFWKRGGFGALPYFYLWQATMPRFIRSLGLEFDLVHNLNFHNDWTPTFLGNLGKPLVWGPVGHHPAIPKEFIQPVYGKKAWLKDQATWALKQFFWRFSGWLKDAAIQSRKVLAMNSGVGRVLPVGDKTVLMPAVGATRHERIRIAEPNRFEILSVGRFVPLKGFDITLKAFALFVERLSPEEREEVKLNLVGKGGLEDWIRKTIADLKIENQVNIISWMPRDEFVNMYQRTDLFFFPSHEGAGMVIPEAFSYGVPVLCLDNEGPGEFTTASSGISIPYGPYKETIMAFADQLSGLFYDREWLENLSLGARQRFEEYFDWEVKGEKIAELYREILSETKAQTGVKSMSVATK